MVKKGVWVLCCLPLLVGCSLQPPATPQEILDYPEPQRLPANTLFLPLAAALPSPQPTPTHPAADLTPAVTPTLPPCSAEGLVLQYEMTTQRAGLFRYRVFYPPCYGQDGRRYPVLYLLPGNIHNDSIWDDLGLDETASDLILSGEIPPLLIVLADGGWLANHSSGGPASYEGLVRSELIPHIEGSACSWNEPAGRAIGGLSRGGYWALEIAFRFPGEFVSTGGHSAALIDSFAGPAINPRYTGISQDLGKLRVYLDIGRDDYLRNPIMQLHEEMTVNGVPHTWVLNDGRHEEAYWQRHLRDYLLWYGAAWPTQRSAYPPCP